jgi:anaerobic nitric oxide reductase transcription regulator
VRELENIVSRAVLRATAGHDASRGPAPVTPAHLDVAAGASAAPTPEPRPSPSPSADPRPLRARLEEFERRAILDAVEASKGNWAAAARSLGVHRSNLHHRAARLGLKSGPER